MSPQWVGAALASAPQQREEAWLQNLAVGSATFVEDAQTQLGIRARLRKAATNGYRHCLEELAAAYSIHFAPEIDPLSDEKLVNLR